MLNRESVILDSEVTVFAIDCFSKWYSQEVNIPQDLIHESKVLSRNNISVRDLVWMEGVKSDFKNMYFSFNL